MVDRTTFRPKYDYSKLRGKIKEVLKTEGRFAKEIGRSHNYITSVFNGTTYFDARDIAAAVIVLSIPSCDVAEFFLTESSQNGD